MIEVTLEKVEVGISNAELTKVKIVCEAELTKEELGSLQYCCENKYQFALYAG